MGNCEKCGTTLTSPAFGGMCPRCLITEGLGSETVPSGDTTRFSHPFFSRFFGDYELLQEVARGGMGVIYKARQRSLGRTVAIKVLSAGEFASPEYLQRFRTEAGAAARLQHPNIVTIHEVGEQDGVHYFSMDYMEGPNLAGVVGERPLAAERAAECVGSMADAIQYAHERGILHRDLKPSNVLIDPFGEPRITDFGLAKELSSTSDLTATGQILGTPGYMPPEQADPSLGAVTPAADVYGLGAILYFTLTARAPFVSASIQETLRQVVTSDPVAPALLNPDVPKNLETICLKCLEREPSRRYSTAAELGADLKRFLNGEPILARPASTLERFSRWCQRRPALAAVWFLVAALAIGSTFSSILIYRAGLETRKALAATKAAEAAGQERLRQARLAEAKAIRRTTIPGRRAQALAALTEAAHIRPGQDLRDEAIASLMIPDIRATESWDLALGRPMEITFDSGGEVAALEPRIATGRARGTATFRRWGQTNTFAQISLSGTNRPIGPLHFSSDSSLVMFRCLDETLRIWHTGENEPFLIVRDRKLPGAPVLTEGLNDDYDFSPDGSLFALGLPEKGISLHRTSDGSETARWTGGELSNLLRMAPDGRHLAAARITRESEQKAYILNVPELTVAAEFSVPSKITYFAWSSDGRLLAISTADSTIALYDLLDNRLLKKIVCAGLGPGDVAFLGGDSFLGVRGSGTTLRLLNLALGQEELILDGYGPAAVASKPHANDLVVASIEGVATRWELTPPLGFRVIPPPRPTGYDMTLNNCCFDFTTNGRWVVSSHGRYTILRDTASGRLLDEWDTGNPSGLEMGTIAFADGGKSIIRCSSQTGLRRFVLQSESRFKPAEPLDPEPGFMICDHTMDAKRLLLVNPEGDEVKIVEITPDGARILNRWPALGAYSAAFSPDGQNVIVNASGLGTNAVNHRIRLYRVADGAVLSELPSQVSCDVAWSADGTRVLTSNGQTQSILWDAKTWQKKATLEGNLGGNMTSFALSADGAFAVIARDETVHLVSGETGAKLASFECPGSSGLAAGLRLLPDGRTFAVLWRDGRIDLIDPAALRAGLGPLGLAW